MGEVVERPRRGPFGCRRHRNAAMPLTRRSLRRAADPLPTPSCPPRPLIPVTD